MSLIDRVAKKHEKSGAKTSLVESAAPDGPVEPVGPLADLAQDNPPQEVVHPVAEDRTSHQAEPPVAEPDIQEPATTPQKRSAEFTLDFDNLGELGYITPSSLHSRTTVEMRQVKQGLMQRMEYGLVNGPEDRKNRQHVVLVTSARPGDGKSFNAVNLALSIVLEDKQNVLLVDADVSRPGLSGLFGLEPAAGLTDLLGDSPPEMADVLQRDREHPLTFLSAGTQVASAADLFGSPKMIHMMQDIAERYTDRIVIFDAPPLLASTEPVALAKHVGQIMFVVDSQRSTKKIIESALDLLESHENVSLVLNKTRPTAQIIPFGPQDNPYHRGADG